MEGSLETIKKYWIYAVLGIFAANSLILDLFFFFPKDSSSQTILPGNINLPNISQNFCPQACIDQMSLNLVSPKATNASVIQPITTLTPTSTPTPLLLRPRPRQRQFENFLYPLGVVREKQRIGQSLTEWEQKLTLRITETSSK